jgi:hypothetical protein
MRTVKIERERWDTECHTLFYASDRGCGCIMGLIGEALGVPIPQMLGRGALSDSALEAIGLTDDLQDRAIEINDNSAISDEHREAKLKELFKDYLILEFV